MLGPGIRVARRKIIFLPSSMTLKACTSKPCTTASNPDEIIRVSGGFLTLMAYTIKPG